MYTDPFGLCRKDDDVCEKLVELLRGVSRKSGDVFDKAAQAFNKWEGGHVKIVRTGSRELGPQRRGRTTLGYCGPRRCTLNEDQGSGDFLITLAHEAGHLPTYPGGRLLHNTVAERIAFYNIHLQAFQLLPQQYRQGVEYFERTIEKDYFTLPGLPRPPWVP